MHGAMEEYETQDLNLIIPSIEFNDMLETNDQETGSVLSRGVTFQPHEVVHSAQQLLGTSSVTEGCLLRKIEWKYFRSPGFPTCRPRITYLRFFRLDGERDVPSASIVGKLKSFERNIPGDFHSVPGVFVVTSYFMTDDILRLRICGSRSPKDFLEAFTYYSLWPLEPRARELLTLRRFDPPRRKRFKLIKSSTVFSDQIEVADEEDIAFL